MVHTQSSHVTKPRSLYRLAAFILPLLAISSAKADLPVIREEKDILPYLKKMIARHRQTASLETSPILPRELMTRNSLQRLAHFKAEVAVPERDQESVLHLQMTEELLAPIKKDPLLKIVNVG